VSICTLHVRRLTDGHSESAGGASVDTYAFAYTDDPIVNGFISESGTAQSFANPWPDNHLDPWYNMTQQIGCGGPWTPIEESVYCVRQKPFQQILAATRISNPLQAILGVFGPSVDEQIVFSDYSLRGALGQFIQKPYLIGNNFYEAGLFKLLGQAGGTNISDADWALFNQGIFQCPTATAAGYRVNQQVPTYRYLYFGAFENLALTNKPPSGAYHTAEISVVFQTIADLVTPPSTGQELKLSRYLNTVWASFAKNPSDGLSLEPRFLFPQYNPYSKSLELNEKALLISKLHRCSCSEQTTKRNRM
jgi:cholinesterase